MSNQDTSIGPDEARRLSRAADENADVEAHRFRGIEPSPADGAPEGLRPRVTDADEQDTEGHRFHGT